MKKLLLISAVAAALASPATFAQGIPVIDAASVAQAISQGVQLAEQIQQLKNQLDQAVQLYNSLNGARGMANLLNTPAARQYLPGSATDLYNIATNTGSFSSISQSIATLKKAGAIVKSEDLTSAGAQKALDKAQQAIAEKQATIEAAFNAAGQRFDKLQTLIDSIDTATDPKAIQDLQARVSAEQVMMQNEMTKLTMMDQIRRTQADLAAQQGREQSAQMGRGSAVYVTPD